jgi:REP element-mobilizing transposase RayT
MVGAWLDADHRPMHAPYWPELGSHCLRKGRISLPGQAYLVTFTAAGRAPIFGDFELACVVSRAICDRDTWPHARLLAWVLMPDHWHGLIECHEAESLSRSVARAKAAATRARISGNGSGISLWAAGYHDHALRGDEAVLDCARYIILNPVRAGLVVSCRTYPFWDAIWL